MSAAPLQCCRYCGRDTRARDGVCHICISGLPPKLKTSRGQKGLAAPRPAIHESLEDRYDDESGPDDVCGDSPMGFVEGKNP